MAFPLSGAEGVFWPCPWFLEPSTPPRTAARIMATKMTREVMTIMPFLVFQKDLGSAGWYFSLGCGVEPADSTSASGSGDRTRLEGGRGAMRISGL